MICLFFIICLIVGTQQQTKIPRRMPGHSIGNSTAPIKLDMFIDWQCVDSKNSWTVIEQVLKHFGDKIYFTYHVLQLWFFRQSGNMAKTAEIIAKHAPSSYWLMTSYFFQHQSNFNNNNYFSKSEKDLYSELAVIAAIFGVNNSTFYNEITSPDIRDIVNTDHVYSKNQIITNTPTYLINGFKDITLNEHTTFDQWIAYIDALL